MRIRAPFAAALAAVVMLVIGFGAGWQAKSRSQSNNKTAEKSEDTPKFADPGWTVKSLDTAQVCGREGGASVLSALAPNKQSPLPSRLVDHMPDRSPVALYSAAADGAWTPQSLGSWEAGLERAVSKGWARGFNAEREAGGFSVAAFQLRSASRAKQAAAGNFGAYICDGGADPFVINEQRGIILGRTATVGGTTIAWWIHGNRIMRVHFTGRHTPAEDTAEALTIIKGVWEND